MGESPKACRGQKLTHGERSKTEREFLKETENSFTRMRVEEGQIRNSNMATPSLNPSLVSVQRGKHGMAPSGAARGRF